MVLDPADAARLWVDARFEAASTTLTTAEYLRFPDEPVANWHINLSLRLPAGAQRELFELGQEIRADIGEAADIANVVPVPQRSLHVSLLWGNHISPARRNDRSPVVEGKWTRRDARRLAAKLEPVFESARPFAFDYDDVGLLPKQVFAVPRGDDWSKVLDLADSVRNVVEELADAGYDASRSPLAGGPVVQTTLLLFRPGIDMDAVVPAVAKYRHNGETPFSMSTKIEQVVWGVHEHRKLDEPDHTGRVGLRETSAVATYDLGGSGRIEGRDARTSRSATPLSL